MKIVIFDKKINQKRINRLFDWLIHMLAYALILITVSIIFKKTVYIDNSYFGLWGLCAAIIIFILNKTIKPIIFWLTLPITGLTLGLFYPFINVLILKIADFILMSHFEINGILMAFLVAVLISIMNIIMDTLIISPLLRKGERE